MKLIQVKFMEFYELKSVNKSKSVFCQKDYPQFQILICKVCVINFNKFNYKSQMLSKSNALNSSISALEDHFPTLVIPNYQTSESLFDYLQAITSRLLPSKDIATVIQKMKSASDVQEYRIQKSMVELESPSFSFIEEICYDAHSTGLQAERDMFTMKNQGDGGSLVDQIWWNAEKKMDSIQYFMD